MSRSVIVYCDAQMDEGGCPQHTLEKGAEERGWDLGKFADFCPTHNPSRRYRGRAA